MAYTTTLTDAGKEMLRNVLMNEGSIIFTSLMVGSGTPPDAPAALTELVNPVVSAPITSITRGSGYFARIVATLYNTEVLTRFNVTELGLYARPGEGETPILYTYVSITEGDGGSVPPGANILIERQYTINVYVADAQDVSADVDSSEAATKAELNAHNVSVTAHEVRFVTKQDRTDLLTASNDVADADYMPYFDTSQNTHRRSTLANLFNYIKSKLTLTASDMPVIPVEKGGTGRTTLTSNSVILGNGTGAVTMRGTTSGAFYAAGTNASPVFGVLPVAQGGTGNNTGYVRAGLLSGAAAGSRATAEGVNTSGTGDNSHAEGNTTVSFGNQSHAEGLGTVANSRSQHVVGEYNVAEAQNKTGRGSFAEVVGNGSSASARSNARTLAWDGTETLAGNFYPMTNNTKDIGSSSFKWRNIFATTLNGALAKKVTFQTSGGGNSGTAFNGSADAVVSYNTVGAAPTTHNHTPAQIATNGTLGAYVAAKASTALGSAYVRNIYAGTADMTPGVTALAYGTIYLVYE